MSQLDNIRSDRTLVLFNKIEKNAKELAHASPRFAAEAGRIARIAKTAVRSNMQLADCELQSVLASVAVAAQMGLEIGVNGQAYLVPYKGKCTLIPGWKGLLSLVGRTGQAVAWTGVVRDGETCVYSRGSSPKLEIFGEAPDDAEINAYYAVGRIKDLEWPVIERWSAEKCVAHRNRYNKVGQRHYSYQHFEMYARKVVLLQVLKYLPSSTELTIMTNLDYAAQAGKQDLNFSNINDVLEGDFANEEADGGESTEEAPPTGEVLDEKAPDQGMS